MSKSQSGATTVEFALSLLVFLTFMLGITDFSRMLFTWNAANEATRLGARYAVVCSDAATPGAVLAKIQALLPQVSAVDLAWAPLNCTPANCEGVTVRIPPGALNYQWISPITGLSAQVFPMPTFSTYLPREIMRQDPNSNTICS
ncbi:TadE family protein [Janthinobacterium sp. 17J80-10]|uniref:TadE/TadG family type IV pilus assembly protein n=1 Tax=Janthinobacterium sp. 17J80-10 TaxID=2497863 RepID=UPI001005585C|nr:TadE family protein [Janthinobacterium sp. 17J80-10]QAU33453.1 pilus assembly protein [Janthinobacterium sp. 17J80-10]